MPKLSEDENKKKELAFLWSLVNVFTAAANGILIKVALDSKIADPLNLICQVIIFATLILVGASLLLERKAFLKIGPKNLFLIALAGLLSTAVNYSLLALGLERTFAINYAFLSQSEVVFVVILSLVFLREKVGFKKIALVCAVISGIYLIAANGAALSFRAGDMLIIAGTFFFSLGVVISKNLLKKMSALTFAAYRNLFGGLFLAGYIFIAGGLVMPVDFLWPLAIGASLSLAVFSLGKVLQYASASYMTIASTATVAVAALGAWLILGETMSLVQIAGGGIILVSVYAANRMDV